LPKEQFLYSETRPIFDLIEETSQRSGVSRAQAFEDFLHMALCSLSGGRMEEQYLQTVQRHIANQKGRRGCDSIAEAFGRLVAVIEETRKDILGDLFQGGITYGEAGQFLTSESICQLMAGMTIAEANLPAGERKTVCDPCCGSGRMLLAAGELQPHWEFIGQDIDLRCVRMTAINLALRNLYGYAIWGDSLLNTQKSAYRTGYDGVGFIYELPRDVGIAVAAKPVTSTEDREASAQPPGVPRNSQFRLF